MHGGVEKRAGGGHGKIQVAVDPAPPNAAIPRQNNFGNFYAPVMDDRNPAAIQRPVVGHMYQPPSNIASNLNSYQYSGQIDNIDERDTDDPLCATEYVHDMYSLFREKEPTTSVRPVFMESQPHINERMRSILVDWLVEVHLKFKLVPETLYLTVNLIDRYLEREEVSRPKLQLVGVTSLLIASKYEEIYPPELRDLVYICDRAYTRADVSFPRHFSPIVLPMTDTTIDNLLCLCLFFCYRSSTWRRPFSRHWSIRSPFRVPMHSLFVT